jgi:hypothetical protein
MERDYAHANRRGRRRTSRCASRPVGVLTKNEGPDDGRSFSTSTFAFACASPDQGQINDFLNLNLNLPASGDQGRDDEGQDDSLPLPLPLPALRPTKDESTKDKMTPFFTSTFTSTCASLDVLDNVDVLAITCPVEQLNHPLAVRDPFHCGVAELKRFSHGFTPAEVVITNGKWR